MTVSQQLSAILRSRKFWILLSALAAIGAAFSTRQIDAWQAVQGLIAAGAAYTLGVAHEDAGNPSITIHAGAAPDEPKTPASPAPRPPVADNLTLTPLGKWVQDTAAAAPTGREIE